MRSCLVPFAVLAAACGPARACEITEAPCGPATVRYPLFTPEGVRIGTVEARVRAVPVAQLSPLSGQPFLPIYGQPGGAAGPVGPDTVLMPLPAARPSAVRGAFPRGY